MPDPLLYLQATFASLVSSVICVLVVRWALSRMTFSNRWIGILSRTYGLLAIGVGAACGFVALRFRFIWPPVNGLDRFLAILLPAAFVIEFAEGFPQIPRRFVHVARIALIAMSGRILLHGSTYLSPDQSEWTDWQLAMVLVLSPAVLAAVWILMVLLSERSTDVSIPLSIAMATLSAGILVMMAGYLKGGGAAFPLAAALFGSTVGASRIRHGGDRRGVIGIGILGLFCVLFIGRFFGGLTTTTAIVVLVAPLLCWTAELPGLRQRKPWQIAAFRLAIVAIPLLVVLAIAKREFDREMRPLLRKDQGTFWTVPLSTVPQNHVPTTRTGTDLFLGQAQ